MKMPACCTMYQILLAKNVKRCSEKNWNFKHLPAIIIQWWNEKKNLSFKFILGFSIPTWHVIFHADTD